MVRLANAEFQIDEKKYLLGIEVGLFKVKAVYLGEQIKCKLPYGKIASGIRVDWKNLSVLESCRMWFVGSKLYQIKQRKQKRCKPRGRNSGECSRRNISQK